MVNPGETALLLVCPEAEAAVSELRSAHDPAAQDGIPAHVTVIYPFKPLDALDDSDHARLEEVIGGADAFDLRGSRTGWFGERVLFVAPDDPGPVLDLISRVVAAFPEFPPYRGEFAEVVPHLTVGHDRPIDQLREVERDLLPRLPFDQRLDHVELWTGPAVDGRDHPAGWRRVHTYRLRS